MNEQVNNQEVEILRKYPFARESCPKCKELFPEFMRGQVQSKLRKLLKLPYCAIICYKCKKIIGWEKP